ncbi:hypothetical protein SS50377_22605 [Spironucleus salmonicida]|uniref:Transmembrane protein n=1 Tax=Spironucleus salmonicida TaxID=348837 RepID=V6LBP8_9EUKA|nr:hypothetical protein SS50377_22605 [Spironucleus salmonicida]|eukprot:EST41905.1 Hypothetical protein SS50377_18208 [Spironucleus salmonicida]
MQSSRVILNPLTNRVILITTPQVNLKPNEKITCSSQSNQTAIYEVQIGVILFRSNFQFYNAFQNADVELFPQNGAKTDDAKKFVIASYQITFLDNNQIQQGVVGQLLETYYNYNECIYNPTIQFTTYKSILPKIEINPNCNVKSTGDPYYISILNGDKLYTKTIEKDKFDFTKLVLQGMDCASGTDAEKRLCKNASVTISSSNFLDYQLYLVIPNKIKAENVYIDSYGKEQKISIEIPFNLVFSIQIQDRVTDGDCISSSQLSFSDNVIHIIQTKKTDCSFQEFFEKQYWIVAQDNRGYTFQIQFYVNTPFELDDYVTCSAWEISDYDSMEDCQNALMQVSEHINHVTLSVIYKAYSQDKTYVGSYIFASTIIPGGECDIVLTSKRVCIVLPHTISTSRTFATIEMKIGKSIEMYQQRQIDISILDNFQYPSVDNIYCFNIDLKTQILIDQISFQQYFGLVYILGSQYQIENINPLIQADIFWQGWLFLVSGLFVQTAWVILKSICKRKKQLKYEH